MIDFFFENMWVAWLLVAIVCLIAELSSGDMFILCFSIGAAFAMGTALLELNIIDQVLTFVLFSVMSIFLVRPLVLKFLYRKKEQRKSNTDALIGHVGFVSERILAGGYGRVKIGGDDWKAQSTSSEDVAVGEKVTVVSVNSAIITVEKYQ